MRKLVGLIGLLSLGMAGCVVPEGANDTLLKPSDVQGPAGGISTEIQAGSFTAPYAAGSATSGGNSGSAFPATAQPDNGQTTAKVDPSLGESQPPGQTSVPEHVPDVENGVPSGANPQAPATTNP